MKQWIVTIVAVAVAVAGVVNFGSPAAWAGHSDSFVNQRQRNQEQLIQQAWQSGQLTPGEYQHLESQQQHFRTIEARMRADGRLDAREKTQLNEMLNHSERAIDRCLHNRIQLPK